MRPSLDDDHSPREVLVALLLAAFVIVVAAFLVTVMLDMGQEPGRGDPATVSIDFDEQADAIHVTFTSMSRPGTHLVVTVRSGSDDSHVGTVRLTRVGSRTTFDDLSDGLLYDVVVVAEVGDERTLLETGSGRV